MQLQIDECKDRFCIEEPSGISPVCGGVQVDAHAAADSACEKCGLAPLGLYTSSIACIKADVIHKNGNSEAKDDADKVLDDARGQPGELNTVDELDCIALAVSVSGGRRMEQHVKCNQQNGSGNDVSIDVVAYSEKLRLHRGGIDDLISVWDGTQIQRNRFGKLFIEVLTTGLQNTNNSDVANETCILLDMMYSLCPDHWIITADLNSKFSIVGWRTF